MFVEDPKAKFTQPIEPQATPAWKKDPYALSSLIAWLETQPADKEYCWAGYCLFEQYGEACGLGVGQHAYVAILGEVGSPKTEWGRLTGTPEGRIAIYEPRTFGGALQRARELQAREACGSKASI